MPRLAIDLVHPADVNFFKHAVRRLRNDGWDVDFLCRSRDNLEQVFASEFPGETLTLVGTHQAGTARKLAAAVTRPVAVAAALKGRDVDVVTGFGSHFAAFGSRLVGARSVIFYDDYEYVANVRLCRAGAHRLVMMPDEAPDAPLVLKELAYLHPDVFAPSNAVCAELGVTAGEFVFLRDKEYVALNYRRERGFEEDVYDALAASDLDVVALTHAAGRRDTFRDLGFRVLDRPVDIHSLLAAARGVVTFGDTMAREAALLGTPTLFLGDRTMRANAALEAAGVLVRGATGADATRFLAALPPRSESAFDAAKLTSTTDLIVQHITEVAA